MHQPGIYIENGTTIGKSGLSTHLMPPEGARVVSIADVLEILRWMHADLRLIHRAFSEVAKIREALAEQSIRHTRSVRANEELAREAARLANEHQRSSESVLDKLTDLQSGIAEVLSEIRKHDPIEDWLVKQTADHSASLARIEARILLPWWKKLR